MVRLNRNCDRYRCDVCGKEYNWSMGRISTEFDFVDDQKPEGSGGWCHYDMCASCRDVVHAFVKRLREEGRQKRCIPQRGPGDIPHVCATCVSNNNTCMVPGRDGCPLWVLRHGWCFSRFAMECSYLTDCGPMRGRGCGNIDYFREPCDYFRCPLLRPEMYTGQS